MPTNGVFSRQISHNECRWSTGTLSSRAGNGTASVSKDTHCGMDDSIGEILLGKHLNGGIAEFLSDRHESRFHVGQLTPV